MRYNVTVNSEYANYKPDIQSYNKIVGKKKHSGTIRLDILPVNRSKRSEGLDILARLIARSILAENHSIQKNNNSPGKEKLIEK
jgi:hypothetical protein